MRHHPANFPVAPLAQRHRDPGIVALAAVQPGLDRAIALAADRHPLGQRPEHLRRRIAEHPHPVAPQPAIARQLQAPGQPAVIGQQQQPLGIQIQPPDADHPRQARRQRLEHRRPVLRVPMRGHQPDRLVIAPQPCPRRRINQLAVDHHEVVRLDEGRGMANDSVVQLHPPLGQQLLGIAPAGHPRPGQPLGDTLAARPSGGILLRGVVFRHVGRVAHWAHAATRASKMRRSPGSMKNSGCHCTPRQKR